MSRRPRRPRPRLALLGVAALLCAALTACSSGAGGSGAGGSGDGGSAAATSPTRPATPGTTSSSPDRTPPAGTASPSPGAAAPPSACVRQQLAELSLSQRAGQVLMIGVPVRAAAEAASTVRRYQLGGVFLAGRSTASVSSIRSRTDALRAATGDGPGLLVAADQEGGAVQTLTGKGFTDIPAALVQGGWSDDVLASRTRSWAAGLARAGISMNLAPVADTVTRVRALENPPIGRFQREYGHTSASTARAVSIVVKALDDEKVLATVKHFPGLGRVRVNTDTSSRAVDGATGQDDVYLRPFVAGIQAGAGAVMVSSALYPRLDAHVIAPFSRAVITGLLRERLGYGGVVMSDDLGRARAVTAVPAGQRATRFVAAGGDIVLSVLTSDAATMRDALVTRGRDSAAFKAQLDAAVIRVLQLKERAGLLLCT